MATWYYIKVRKADTGEFLGWLHWNLNGTCQFNGAENEKQTGDNYFSQLTSEASYLRCPAYTAHGSATLGGSGDNGYYAAWDRGEDGGYLLTIDGSGQVTDDNGRTLSLYTYGNANDASWETKDTQAVSFEYAIKKET